MGGTALLTGSAGFIGFHTASALLQRGWKVVGIDNLNPYYDPELKEARHRILGNHANFEAVIDGIERPGVLATLMAEARPDTVIHLAAQAGVRHSIENPSSYVEANLSGTFALLEAARAHPPRHLLMASTSSVYGAETEMPYRETMAANHQMSFYAATKKANEAMAHSYAHLFGLPITMFRFFTVFGPWGRPDMALFRFTRAILEGRPIDVFNHGAMRRDFTYVDDLVEGLCRLLPLAPPPAEARGAAIPGDSLSPAAPWRVVNIGHGSPVELEEFIEALERALGRRALRNLLPMQPGDVPATWADTGLLTALAGPLPRTPLDVGIARFVRWYLEFYGAPGEGASTAPGGATGETP